LKKKFKASNKEYDSNFEEKFYHLWREHSSFPITHHWEVNLSRKWELDFAFPAQKIAIELQGYGQGHISYLGMKRDYEKHNDLILDGWYLVYFMSTHTSENPTYPISILRSLLEKRNVRIRDFDILPQGPKPGESNNLANAARRIQNQRFNQQNQPRQS